MTEHHYTTDLPVDPSKSTEWFCRVCSSRHVAFVRGVKLQRVPQTAPLYYCMDCESFLHPQIYREPPEQLERDAKWHVSVEDRNRTWAGEFFDAALARAPLRSVIEIGCGTGSFLSVALERGLVVHGHDSNPHVVAPSRERHGIHVDSSLWTAEGTRRHFDLVVCISTLEHITDPRSLTSEIAAYCRRERAAAYLSVPFATERPQWDLLWEAQPRAGNPLYLSDVHITHFSKKGFEIMVRDAGATEVTYFKHGWMGYWLKF